MGVWCGKYELFTKQAKLFGKTDRHTEMNNPGHLPSIRGSNYTYCLSCKRRDQSIDWDTPRGRGRQETKRLSIPIENVGASQQSAFWVEAADAFDIFAHYMYIAVAVVAAVAVAVAVAVVFSFSLHLFHSRVPYRFCK